jgi:hypothetical protein
MKNFEIKTVISGADTDTTFDPPTNRPLTTVLSKWTDVTVRVEHGFDWMNRDDANALFKKLRQACELNDES